MRSTMLVAAVLVTSTALAQSHGHHGAQSYSGMEAREIKALSTEEIDQLRAGAGMGLAMAAELNHYPGPKHVLELSGELGLTENQRSATTRAFDEMKAAAIEIGSKVVEMESHLDRAFADGSIDDARLDAMTSHIARLRGELRAAHLRAHLRMKAILTPEQIAAYDRLRGYQKPNHVGN